MVFLGRLSGFWPGCRLRPGVVECLGLGRSNKAGTIDHEQFDGCCEYPSMDDPANLQMEPTRLTVPAIMSPWRAAHLGR
jgi:hypothetical protein